MRAVSALLLLMFMATDTFARCGVERWHVKTGIDPMVGSVKLAIKVASTVTKLATIPRKNAGKGLPDNKRFPPVETTLFTLDATLTGFKIEDDPSTGDSDYHLVLTDEHGRTMVAEIPDPHCVDKGSALLAQITAARKKFDDVFTATSDFTATQTPVKITGVGFFDRVHNQTGVAPNGIELHPVLDIEIGKPPADALATFVTPVATLDAVDPEPDEAPTGAAPPAPPPPATSTSSTPPGAVWTTTINRAFSTTAPKLEVVHDKDVRQLAVAESVRSAPALARLARGDAAVLRVDKDQVTRVETVPVSTTARLLAFLGAGLPVLLFFVLGRRLLQGADGPYSKSTFQVALWFGVLLTAYGATLILRVGAGGAGLVGGVNIPPHLALLSGISAFTFAAAKGIRVGQEKRAARPVPPAARTAAHFPRDLFIDSQGNPDLGDVQMLILTLLAAAVYLVTVWAWTAAIPVYSPVTLPDVDTTLLAAAGLGQGAYLLKKQVSA